MAQVKHVHQKSPDQAEEFCKGVPIWHFCRYADTLILVIADMPILPIFSGFKFTEKGVESDSDSNPDPSFLVPITPLLFSLFPTSTCAANV